VVGHILYVFCNMTEVVSLQILLDKGAYQTVFCSKHHFQP
jgi:hypothetical protein